MGIIPKYRISIFALLFSLFIISSAYQAHAAASANNCIFVLDTSGSIKKSDPHNSFKEAINLCMDLSCDTNNQVALVSYNEESTVVFSPNFVSIYNIDANGSLVNALGSTCNTM